MDLGSGIRKKPIPDPGSRGQKGTGSRIRIRNTGNCDPQILNTTALGLIWNQCFAVMRIRIRDPMPF